MDSFLSKLTQQAMNYAIRSGIAITASFAIQQSTRLIKNVSGEEKAELLMLQNRLHSKVRIISPAIDMIELIAARGNTSLESSISLTKSLRLDIQNLGQRLARAATVEERSRRGPISSRERDTLNKEVRAIIQDIKSLLERIEDAVPLINLAITTSGATLSTSLPSTVSPSRLLQASTFLSAGDMQYAMFPNQAVQVGPTFTLSIYMLFAGHIRPRREEHARSMTWKEVIHKARVKIRRVPMDMVSSLTPDPLQAQHFASDLHIREETKTDEFAYQMLVIEDLEDGRVHTFEDDNGDGGQGTALPGPCDGVNLAGIRDVIPIHQISKIFYADTGKILNIGSEGEVNNPVLLLKRDINAIPPRRMMMDQQGDYYADWENEEEEVAEDDDCDEVKSGNGGMPSKDGRSGGDADEEDGYQSQLQAQLRAEASASASTPKQRGFPPNLDPEWIAFEVFQDDSDDASDTERRPSTPSESRQPPSSLAQKMQNLDLQQSQSSTSTPGDIEKNKAAATTATASARQAAANAYHTTVSNPLFTNLRTSLSLLEMLFRLTSLQQFQQQSHLSITDELLNFFLAESSTTGAGGDEPHRQRLRSDARRKVGWDPYDESPVKLRGEDYQYTGHPLTSSRLATPDGDATRPMPSNSEFSAEASRRKSFPPVTPSTAAGAPSPLRNQRGNSPTLSPTNQFDQYYAEPESPSPSRRAQRRK